MFAGFAAERSKMTTSTSETGLKTLVKFREVNADFPETTQIAEFKAQGRKVFGWLCTYVPEELVHAAGALPVRVTGYPQETDEDMKKTILFAKKLPLFGANFFPFHPLPGTPIHADLTARGEFHNIDWNAMGQDRIPYVPQGISKKRFTRLLTQAYLRFYLRPGTLFHILASIRSFRRLQYIFQRILRILT